MRVLHVIPSVSPKHGGPSRAIEMIAGALSLAGVEVTIATTDDDGDGNRMAVPLGEPVLRGAATYYFFRRDISVYKVSRDLRRWLNANVAAFDAVHVHALFSYSSTVAVGAARKHCVPYVVRPLGVLNRWGMENRRAIAKRISIRFIERAALKDAAAIHFTSEAERDEALQLFPALAGKSAIIPLPMEPVSDASPAALYEQFPTLSGKRVVLYLSRISPKKRLELLLEAFSLVRQRNNDIALLIAGSGPDDYLAELRRLAKRLNISGDVVWAGHLAGAEKAGAFRRAEVFVLPSASENFGIAVAEALAHRTAVIVTKGVAISREVLTWDAGLVADDNARSVADSIANVLGQPDEARRRATNGQRLVEHEYSFAATGQKLGALYQKIVDGAKR